MTRCFPFLAPDFCAAADVVTVKLLQSNCGLFINDHTLKTQQLYMSLIFGTITKWEGTRH